MTLLAFVDWDALLEMLWTATIAGLGVTAAYGIASAGTTKAFDLSRLGNRAGAAAYGLVGLVALAVVLAAVVGAIIVMTTK